MLVGRRRELEVLARCMDDLRAPRARGLLLSGEPGIGKSTLLAHLRTVAAERGSGVASVVSHDGALAPPYAPWSSILEQLDQPMPAIDATGIGADDHRLQVRRIVLRAIRDAASRRPVVITLDDVQWLDQLSREVLLHLLRELDTAPVLLAGAWRTPVTDRDPDFLAFVANLHREPEVRWLELAGMDAPEVAAVAGQLGWAVSATDARELTMRTSGNPFFVSELARLAVAREAHPPDPGTALAENDIPSSIRHVVQMRFNGLPARTQEMLRVASIFPQGADFALLQEMTGLAENDLLDAIDEALASDFLRPTERTPEHHAFTHGIVREAIAASWSPSRRARLHRRAAETLERLYAGRTGGIAGELARHYVASRSLEGAERGIPHALAGAEAALQAFDYAQAAHLLGIARALASAQPLAERAVIEWRLALAQAESLKIDDAVATAERAVDMLLEARAAPDTVAHACWQLAHALNAVGAGAAVRRHLQETGLRTVGNRRDLHWARLRLLDNPIVLVPHDELFAARWVGFDPEAQRIARHSEREEDQVQTIESFDPRTPGQTRGLIALVRTWRQPRAALRGLTAAANDLTYRHGEFRLAMGIWNEVLATAQRIGAVAWQANALNQVTLLHVTFGEFAQAVTSKRLADEANALLGPASDAEALLMERDLALTTYLDGDWPTLATYWLGFVGEPPLGLEAQLAGPLYAAMAASAAATAGLDLPRARRLVDALAEIVTQPGIQQVNGVVAWAADAIAKLGDRDRAATFDRLAAGLLAAGIGDYPQTSLALTRARMLTLRDDPLATRMFDRARESLALQGQVPLLGIACYEQAVAPGTSPALRKRRLEEALAHFDRLGMTSWHERALAATATAPPARADLAGISRRELEVLRMVARGSSDRDVADALYISERTVHAHMRSMMRKTETRNRTGLSSWARDRGILEE